MIDLAGRQANAWFICAFVVSVAFAAAATAMFTRMCRQVDNCLSPAARIPPVMYPGLLPKVERLHREYYPESRLRLYLNATLAACAFAGVVAMFTM
jgi:hypothetical protein